MSETEESYRAILAREPDNQAALYELGIIVARAGRREEAYGLFGRAAKLGPPSGELLCALGRVAAQLDKDEEAQACFRRALDQGDEKAAALAGLGALAYKAGRLDEAFGYLTEAVALAPDRADVRNNLAGVHLRRGEFAVAEQQLRAALATDADNADFHNRLGVVLLAQGRHGEAEASLRAALELEPEHTEAHCNLGITFSQAKRPGDAMACFRATLARQPDHQAALVGLGTALQLFNRTDEARAAFARAAKINPRNWWARWALLVALPILARDESEIAEARRRFAADLADWERDLSRFVAIDHAAMTSAVASRTNFYLHYHGENDRDLQRRYGRIVTQIAAAAFPRYAKPRAARTLGVADKIRVGFASAFLRHHSVVKTHGAWIADLPRARFEVTLFQLGAVTDETTERLRRDSRYHDCARLSPAALVETIARENLDVLIWLDIGMEGRAQIPAALYLAGTQAGAGGHPVTSGLPSIGYYLSSDLMEPADGEAHYTETLVRLPNLAACYPAPPGDGGAPPPLLAGLRAAGRVIYLCGQSLYKLLPQHDAIFAAVARAVPEATILFIASREPAITEFFRERMTAAFARQGLAADRVQFVPHLAQRDFYALNRGVDVVLDSFAWSGDNSTFEALAFDRPVVTLPGASQRGRHSAAILTRLGMPELIARDREDYVAISARLGRDPAWRAEVMRKIAERKSVLFDDPAPVAALAAWLESVARRTA